MAYLLSDLFTPEEIASLGSMSVDDVQAAVTSRSESKRSESLDAAQRDVQSKQDRLNHLNGQIEELHGQIAQATDELNAAQAALNALPRG